MERTDTLAVPVILENADFHYAVQSGTFVWPWNSNSGLLVIRGAAGGGGGGAGGRTDQCKALPVRHFVSEGSKRTVFLASNGGSGGKGFPGETRVVELELCRKETCSTLTLVLGIAEARAARDIGQAPMDNKALGGLYYLCR